MNLNYDLKKLNQDGKSKLSIFIDKKKLTLSDFLCYMQYEFFCSFFISVLNDINKDKYKDIEFPVFQSANFGNPFELVVYFNESKPPVSYNKDKLELIDRQKYVNVLSNSSHLIFIPNKKVNIDKLFDMILPENKILFQKILKVIFDKIFLILQNDMTKKIKLNYKNNFLIFILQEN
jgi:hypothetical protein